MDTSFLEEIGLTRGESKVYLSLLEIGATTAGPLISRCGIQKSAVYFCLESLIGKGLVTYITKNNVKNFEAASPQRLLDFLETQEKGIKKQKEKAQKVIPNLFAKMNVAEKKSAAKIFEGWNGMKSAFDDILHSSGPKDEYLIYSVCVEPAVLPRFRRLIGKFHSSRYRKRIPAKIIIGAELKNSIGKDRSREPFTEIRYLPKELTTPAAINVYADKMLLAIWTKEPSALLIENKSVSDSFRNYFKALWASAKKG
ncbi:MAG: helix-turn-helix domain-containing protein [Candidatus Diapherotrites archaeon]